VAVGRRMSVDAPTVRAPPRLIHLSVGLIVQLLLGARTNHVYPLVPATTNVNYRLLWTTAEWRRRICDEPAARHSRREVRWLPAIHPAREGTEAHSISRGSTRILQGWLFVRPGMTKPRSPPFQQQRNHHMPRLASLPSPPFMSAGVSVAWSLVSLFPRSIS